MGLRVSASRARELLSRAEREPQRLRRHLLVAAAIREVCGVEPVIVGGTAEEYWTADEYHQTDLDLCGPLSPEDQEVLRQLGFTQDRRHWYHEQAKVAVEFPAAVLDGDPERIHRDDIGGGTFTVIGVDDLYLHRLRQATVTGEATRIEFQSALAVAAARYEDIDWPYVRRRIVETEGSDPPLGAEMRRLNSLIRKRARKAIAESS